MPGHDPRPAPGHGGGGVVALEGEGRVDLPGVEAGQGRDDQGRGRRQAEPDPARPAAAERLQARAVLGRAVRPRIAPIEGGDAARQAREVVGGEVPEPVELVAVARLELFGEPEERPLQAERVQVGGGAAVAGLVAVRADREDRAPGRVLRPARAGSSRTAPRPASPRPSSKGRRRGRALALALGRRGLLGQDAVELGQEQGDGAAGGRVVGAVDVPFEQVLHLLLASPAVGRAGRAVGVEAEQDGVAIGEELPGSARRSRA